MGVIVRAACRPYWNHQVHDLDEGTVIPAGEFADYLLATGAPVEPEAACEPDPAPSADVPAGSVAEVLAWVGDDLDRARAALEAEQAKAEPRSSLVGKLTKLIEK